jgi:dolichol-phosphate mannosyltransferase
VAETPPDLSVVVPVYNEQGNIVPLLSEIAAALDDTVAYEIVYVDDNSTDDTQAELLQAKARFPALRVFQHGSNAGQSTAILTGIREARAPWIVTLDGDGQNDPRDIHKLLRLRGTPPPADIYMVAGVRRRRRDKWVRRASSWMANGVRSTLLRDEMRDTGCGLKLFRRDIYLNLPYFDHMHRFLPALMRRQGGRVISIPVNHRPRMRGKSKYGVSNRLWVGIVDLFGVMWLQRRIRLTHSREV